MRRFLHVIAFITVLFLPFFNAKAQINQTVNNGAPITISLPAGCIYNWVNDDTSIGLSSSGTGNISFTAVNLTGTNKIAHVIATPSPRYAYIANLGSDNVSVVDIANNTVAATIPVGTQPYSVCVSPDGLKVYVTNTISNTVSVISTTTNTVTTTIPVGTNPIGVAESPDGTKLYVVNDVSETVSVINPATNLVTTTISVGQSPQTVTFSPDGSRAYVVNSNTNNVSVINTATNSVLTTVPVGSTPFGALVSADGAKLYVTNEVSNTVSVINTITYAVSTINVGNKPKGITASPDGTKLYISNFNSNTISVISTSNNTVSATISTGANTNPNGVSLSLDGTRLYVAEQQQSYLSVFDTANNSLITTIPTGTAPYAFGNFISGGSGCSPVTFSITVVPTPPTITAGISTGSISACVGSASANPFIRQIVVSGRYLAGNVTATAPAGFEVSLAPGSGYGSSVPLVESNSTLNATTVYVRSAASATVGNISGSVVLSSLAAAPQSVAVTGIINALPTVNTVSNQTVTNGQATAAVNFTGTANTFLWTNDTPGIGLAASGNGNIASFNAVNNGSTPVIAHITATPITSGFAYIANGASGTISVVNTTTNAVVTSIPVSAFPHGVAVSPDGSRVYVASSSSNTVSIINTATNAVIATIPNGSAPWGVAVTPDGSTAYVANSGNDFIWAINTATNTVTATIHTGGSLTSGLVVSPDGSRLYSANYNAGTLSVINTATNAVISTIAVAPLLNFPAISPDGTRLYITSPSGLVYVINTTTNTIVTSIPTGSQPLGVVVSPDGSRVYVANSLSNTVSVINAATNTVVNSLAITYPTGVSLSPDGNLLYVVNDTAGTLSVINTTINSIITTIPVGTNPISIGNFVTAGTTCSGTPVTFSITVNPTALTPTITTTGAPSALTTTYGTISAPTSFTVSGTNMQGGILVTPPPGFYVSTDNVSYTNAVVVGATGTIAPTIVYVRIPLGTAAGTYSGNIVLSSQGVNTNVNVAMPLSTVTPAPLTITAKDVTKNFGATLTGGPGSTAFTSSGLKNLDVINSVTIAYGSGGASSAAAGTYTGSVVPSAPIGTAFAVTNYTITYVPGNIIVNALSSPTIVASPITGVFSACAGTPSNVMQFTVSGSNLTGNVTATAPAGFEISLTAGSGFGNSVTVNQSGGTANSTVVYVRTTASAATGNYLSSIILTSAGAASQNVDVSGTVYAQATVAPVGNQIVNNGDATAPVHFTGTGVVYQWASSDPTAGIGASGTGDIPSFIATNNTNNFIIATITVTPKNALGCSGTPIVFTIKVNPAVVLTPGISPVGPLSPLNTIYGTPSTVTQFGVSGANLSSGILVTPPPGFELSLDDITFSNSITVGLGGAVQFTKPYIRLKATTVVGSYAGNIIFSSAGNVNATLAMPNSTVSPAPLTVKADNKSKVYGLPNPLLTMSYSGFVNGEGMQVLTTPPNITTTAALTSPVGQYPITLSGGVAANYSFNYVPGVFTITPLILGIVIPNTFTPNGDGINDTWAIANLDTYPNSTVEILNRYGERVYFSYGYPVAWDGKYKGVNLPFGTYYYIIKPGSGKNTISGFVTIIR